MQCKQWAAIEHMVRKGKFVPTGFVELYFAADIESAYSNLLYTRNLYAPAVRRGDAVITTKPKRIWTICPEV